MKIYAKSRADAAEITRVALMNATEVTIKNASGTADCFVVEFDEACIFTDEELTRVLTAGAYYEIESAVTP